MDCLLCEKEDSNHLILILKTLRAQKIGESRAPRPQAPRDLQACDHIQTQSHSYSHHTQRQSMWHTTLPRVSLWEEVFLDEQGPGLGTGRPGNSGPLLCTWLTVTRSVLFSALTFPKWQWAGLRTQIQIWSSWSSTMHPDKCKLHKCYCFLYPHLRTFFLIAYSEDTGQKDVRNIDWLSSHACPNWDQTHNLGMFSDGESNLRPFGLQDNVPTNWATLSRVTNVLKSDPAK